MSQGIWSTIDPDTTSGTQLATLLNDLKNALTSSMSGTTRPTELDSGGIWLDTANEGTPNFYWDLKLWNGTVDIRLFRINLSTNTINISGSDSPFAVTKISADTVGPLLKLVKNRIATSGQVLNGDVIGELQFVGRASDSTDPVTARIVAHCTDDMTAIAQGTYLTFEAIEDATASLSEVMRMVDKKLGIGTTTPVNTLHVTGTGIRSQNLTDTANGAKSILKKARITGTGATQSADVVGQVEWQSTDQLTADLLVAKTEVVATEAHTSTAGGSQWKLSVSKIGSVALTEKIRVGEKTELLERVSIEALELDSQEVGTATSITALSSTKSIVKLTGTTVTSLKGIDATGNTKCITIHNASTAAVTIEEEDAGATAANRFSLPNARPITLGAKESTEFFYNATESRWKLKSGSGSGGGGTYVVSAEQTVTAGGTVTTTTVDSRQLRLVKGDVGGVAASTTPFGSGGGWTDGTEITLVGTDVDNYLEISYNDASYGVIGNFSSVLLTKGRTATFIWVNALTRFIYAGGL